MSGHIQQHYSNKELPGIDCIIYENGNMIIFDHINAICDTTIQSVEKYLDEVWTEIEFHPDHLILDNGNKLRFGEGAMGNEGFIACENPAKNLIWAYFTTNFNPFNKVFQIDTDSIEAHSTNGYILTFNLQEPWKISIKYPS